jgi:N6-adenosine-specific RNA methylase IME4
MAPEHKRLNRYGALTVDEISSLRINQIADPATTHLYLRVPNALFPWGLRVLNAWGFEYRTNLVWEKVRKDGKPDGRGVGFTFTI